MFLRLTFLLISSLGLLAALGTVLARNLVRAALFLVAFFFIVACQFVLLEADFLAAIQVLVYIGAVAILLLFGIMLTRNIQGDETTRSTPLTRAAGGLAALAVLAMLIVAIQGQRGMPGSPSWSDLRVRPAVAAPGAPSQDSRSRAVNEMTGTVGIEMMTRYVVAFELAGLLLTAALVGAIALALSHQDELSGSDRTLAQIGKAPPPTNPAAPLAAAGSTGAPTA